MTKQEFEQKCTILASTPQNRWFDLRFKALLNMLDNARIARLDIAEIFPKAKMNNFVGFVCKFDDTYYFVLVYKQGFTYECFNVETTNFYWLSNILSSHIVLSSDDDAHRITFLPQLMMLSGFNDKKQLKSKLDHLFNIAIPGNGVLKL